MISDEWAGREILDEDLREHCLHQKVKADHTSYKWWDYMSYINANCTVLNAECSKEAHNWVNEDYFTTLACVATNKYKVL